jgi:hypothetical protein
MDAPPNSAAVRPKTSHREQERADAQPLLGSEFADVDLDWIPNRA